MVAPIAPGPAIRGVAKGKTERSRLGVPLYEFLGHDFKPGRLRLVASRLGFGVWIALPGHQACVLLGERARSVGRDVAVEA